ncbi:MULTISPECIES: peptidylprolyl isomerase [Bacillus]|uniref:peptidylprolyl isomerase n=1 Tax=Bacillus TaxID=1386 RepID=UPI0002EB3595|nr:MULTISPECIES: peptidylprolyl isomerase [Bacillus]
MKKWLLPVALTASLVGLTACSNGDSETVVETKAGNITKDELYTALKDTNGQQVLQALVYEKILADKYKVSDKELDERVNTLKEQLGDQFDMALLQYGYKDEADLRSKFKIAMMQEKAAIKGLKVSDKELKEAYENYKPEIKASHILVDDEKTAKEIKQKLDNGAKFEDLAKEYSTDTASAEKGGDLGWFGQGKMVTEFEDAAYALNKGQISNPVKTEHGYHIIKLTDKKEKKSFDDMKKDLEYQVKVSKIDNEQIEKVMKKELKEANVEIKDKDLKNTFGTNSDK